MLLAALMLRNPLPSPPGHHTSPVVGDQDVAWASRPQPDIACIDLNVEAQLQLMSELATYWGDLPDERQTGWRYRSSTMFQPTDATVYYAMLQHFRPTRLIEVGSGYTSALALDTRDRHLPGLQLTFIDPFPERLHGLLGDQDRADCRVIERPVQDVDLDVYDALEAGDFLFLDTSHFAKTGSEVNWLVFNVLPRVRDGVIVHFHDIFWPFEYPREWLDERRSYTELYAIRAFLMYNPAFVMLLFSSWVWHEHRELFTGVSEDYSGGEAGSLWLRKSTPVLQGP
jgi:hypothetical protein